MPALENANAFFDGERDRYFAEWMPESSAAADPEIDQQVTSVAEQRADGVPPEKTSVGQSDVRPKVGAVITAEAIECGRSASDGSDSGVARQGDTITAPGTDVSEPAASLVTPPVTVKNKRRLQRASSASRYGAGGGQFETRSENYEKCISSPLRPVGSRDGHADPRAEFFMEMRVMSAIKYKVRTTGEPSVTFSHVVLTVSSSYVGGVVSRDVLGGARRLESKGMLQIVELGHKAPFRLLVLPAEKEPERPAFPESDSLRFDDDVPLLLDDDVDSDSDDLAYEPNPAANELTGHGKQAAEDEHQAGVKAAQRDHYGATDDGHPAANDDVYDLAPRQKWLGEPKPTALILRGILNAHFDGRGGAMGAEVRRTRDTISFQLQRRDVLSMLDGRW